MESYSASYYTSRSEAVKRLLQDAGKTLVAGSSAETIDETVNDALPDHTWFLLSNAIKVPCSRRETDILISASFDEGIQKIPDYSFNTVILPGMLLEFSDHDILLKTFRRKTAPGGSMIVDAPNFHFWGHLSSLLSGEETERKKQRPAYFSLKSLLLMFKKSGFTLSELYRCSNHFETIPDILLGALKDAGVAVANISQESEYSEYIMKIIPDNESFRSKPLQETSELINSNFKAAIKLVRNQEYISALELAEETKDIIVRSRRTELVSEKDRVDSLIMKLAALKGS